jgi:hypothetical protein
MITENPVGLGRYMETLDDGFSNTPKNPYAYQEGRFVSSGLVRISRESPFIAAFGTEWDLTGNASAKLAPAFTANTRHSVR